MRKTEIYYFSGTGNSLAVARDIAQGLDARLIPAASVVDQESIKTEADAIGLVFPIYDFKPPQMIEALVRKLDEIDSKYLFAVCTYGIAAAGSLKHLGEVIASCGGHLAGGFATGMPHSGVGSAAVTEAEQERLFARWRARVDEICGYIRAEEGGRIESSNLLLSALQPSVLRKMPSALKFLTRMLLKGVNSLDFTAGEACNGCGICERICPAGNIEMVDDRPVWSDHCEGCFACLNWCPKEAITLGGRNIGMRPYHHPNVTLSDMIAQRQRAAGPGAHTTP